MSNENPATPPQPSMEPDTGMRPAGSSAEPAPTSSVRKLVLGVVFILLLAALIYDYGVARPSVNQAYDAVTDQFQQTNFAAQTLTRDQIETLLGRSSSDSFSDGQDTVQVYHWASGLPMKNHKLFVVYENKDDGKGDVFLRHSKYVYDAEASLVARSPEEIAADQKAKRRLAEEAFRLADDQPAVTNDSPTDPSSMDDPAMTPTPTPPGSAADAWPPFETLDTDGDGLLSDTEWSEPLRAQVTDLDQDGDGKISRDEYDLADKSTLAL